MQSFSVVPIKTSLTPLNVSPVGKGWTHGHCTGFPNMTSSSSHRWSLPIAACKLLGWHMNPLDTLYWVLEVYKNGRGWGEIEETLKISRLMTSPKSTTIMPQTFKTTTIKNINPITCNRIQYIQSMTKIHTGHKLSTITQKGERAEHMFSFR